jgi:hypothetical protein
MGGGTRTTGCRHRPGVTATDVGGPIGLDVLIDILFGEAGNCFRLQQQCDVSEWVQSIGGVILTEDARSARGKTCHSAKGRICREA